MLNLTYLIYALTIIFEYVKQNQIYIIIALMALAILGIITLQVQQTLKAMKLSEEQFYVSVSQSLNKVVDRLISESVKTQYLSVTRRRDVANEAGIFVANLAAPAMEENIELEGYSEVPRQKQLRKLRNRDSITIVTEQLEMIPEDTALLIQGTQSFVFTSEDSAIDMKIQMPANPHMLEIINATIQGFSTSPVPSRDRVDSLQLDSVLRQTLYSHGIKQEVDYMVEIPRNQEIIFRTADHAINDYTDSPYKVRLFPFQQHREQIYLHVFFPNQGYTAFKKIWLQAIGSLMFAGIILVCFWVSVRTIFRQKQLSEMKNDFINNMTHELKTPIATISLAADALNNPRVQASEDGISRYTGIIKEENLRMNRQVERVLQAAKFEKREIQLKKEWVDVHSLISSAVAHIRLQVVERDGELITDLAAEKSEVYADRVHMSNILYNLLDNANKYSPGKPMIEVRTENRESFLYIHVKDEGLGINKSDLPQIFTRFYRVSTGDLHDVKGFGLGLSYVKDILETLGGNIFVESMPGKGSTFSIQFPLERKT